MKKYTLIAIIIAAMLVITACAGSTLLDDAFPQDLKTENGGNKTSFIHADWPYYHTAKEIIDASSYIFAGTVTDIYFEIVDLKTGKADRDADSQSTSRAIQTVYTIEISKTYKGNERSAVKLCAEGGVKGYKEAEQNELLRSAGLLKPGSDCIVICDTAGITLEPGREYLFCTYRGIGDFDFIVNATQFAFSLDSYNAIIILDALK